MSPLNCPDVEARLDLYAADECDPAEAEAIRRHLARCPRCTAVCDEARQFVGLLDLRLQEPERLRRLEARIEAEAEPRRRVLRFPSGLRRAAALAAMLLLNVALAGWLMPGLALVEGDGGLVVALHQEKARGGPEAVFPPAADGARAVAKGAPEEFRQQLAEAKATGRVPPAPAVDLKLELRNTSARPMRVWVSGPRTELRLDLRGPGAVSAPAKDVAEAEPEAVTLRPGGTHVIKIDRLTDGRPGERRSWYWTEPGDYTVTAHFTTTATVPGVGERKVTARSEPVTIPVPGP
jgi:hypothetical protein